MNFPGILVMIKKLVLQDSMGKSVCARACVAQCNCLTALSFCHSLHQVTLSPTGPLSTAGPNMSNLKPTLEASVGTASQSATAPLEYRKDPFPWQKFVPKSWKQHGKVLMLASTHSRQQQSGNPYSSLLLLQCSCCYCLPPSSERTQETTRLCLDSTLGSKIL